MNQKNNKLFNWLLFISVLLLVASGFIVRYFSVAQEKTPVLSEREKELNYFYAVENINNGKYPDAMMQLKTIVLTDPDRVLAWYLLGYAERKNGYESDAIQSFNKFLDKCKKSNKYIVSARIELGYLYLKHGQNEIARDVIDRAMEIPLDAGKEDEQEIIDKRKLAHDIIYQKLKGR